MDSEVCLLIAIEWGMRKLTIEEMHELAASRGGKCLSTKYINTNTKLRWQCAEGHQWDAKPSHIKEGSWCRLCSFDKRKMTISEMRHLAKERGGKCLSTQYVNSATALEWQCKKGHRWMAAPNNIKSQKSWCAVCANCVKLTLEDMQNLACAKGGECLSTVYESALKMLRWRCAEGHEWEATGNSVKNSNSWCPECAGNVLGTVEDMQKVANSRGGEFLSDKYTNALSRHLWRCEVGHEFEMRPSNIMNQGQWCPRCANLKNERLCREIFESMLGEPFPARRPKWLLNDRGNRMELDGYCESMGLAFEYQGAQHYELSTRFNTSNADLRRRNKDDERKRLLCKKRNITLIEVPYHVANEEMDKFIKRECSAKGFEIHEGWSKDDLDLSKAYSPKRLLEMQDIAKERGGKCLSRYYVDALTKLRWRCAEGHEWEATSNKVKSSNNWCPKCAGVARLSLKDAQESAKARGGKCLSSEYVNATSPMDWECIKGHRWSVAYCGIRNGAWCLECSSSKKLTITEMQVLAQERGGKCLSTEYKSNKFPLQWECAKGHKWWTPPSNIRNAGSWCPACSGKQKKTIGELQELAASKGGRCLSTKYDNQTTMLQWKCESGHRWKMQYPSIIRGSWCPECREQSRRKQSK